MDINVKVAAKGTDFMNKADEALKKFSLMSFFNSGAKQEEALELYNKAANNYKMAKDWRSASKAFEKCAEMSKASGGSQHEEANYIVQAADALNKIDTSKSTLLYQQAVDIYSDMGRFTNAAKYLEAIGDICEKNQELEKAVDNYQTASDYYAGENATSKSNKNLEKVAFISATLEKYDVATKTFEQLGTGCLDSNLLQFSAKKHFLHAGICHLARGDELAASLGYEKYSQLDFSFGDSREGKLLKELVAAFEAADGDLFSQKLFEYDNISKLTPWETSILLRTKNSLSNEATNGNGEDANEGNNEPDVDLT